ncbi:PAS domain-containing protein [Sphingomonas endophytica]|uniref:histidine kinase n=1 Tax=Sphingomonas endophytica TaxID=869719 RepID=A0A147I8G4_9SPHN|nr:PAS domain-containing protein [Sphingomonas endophytica]KTT75502.1 histidine kinase [Sphingomonas endophytica]
MPRTNPSPLICADALDEAKRSQALAAYDIQSLHGAAALRQITDFAARLCGVPSGIVSILDTDHQTFLARTGVPEGPEPAREHSFCGHTMWGDGLTIVTDASTDPRFRNNPLVTGEMHLRFYAGAPLVSDDGFPMGSLCVLDTVPHPEGLTPLQQEGLTVLAANVLARLRDSRDGAARRASVRQARANAEDSETRFRTLADTMPQMVWSTLPDGYHDYYNARWYDYTGMPEGSTDGEAWNGMFHVEDQERAWTAWRHSLATGEPYEIEYRLRHHDGHYRWVLGRALPIRDGDGRITRWFGTCTDIHEHKLAMEEREVVSQELSHRIKNIFSVVAGLVHLTGRTHPEVAGLLGELRQRITALGRAHDFVRPHSDQSRPQLRQDSLQGLLEDLFIPYQSRAGDRFRIAGADFAVDDRAATPLALIFHELATNASKYGALSTAQGMVELTITDVGDDVVLRWCERGGPPLDGTPGEHGFGSQLIEMSAARQLGGQVTREWPRDGLEVTVTIPRGAFSRSVAT